MDSTRRVLTGVGAAVAVPLAVVVALPLALGLAVAVYASALAGLLGKLALSLPQHWPAPQPKAPRLALFEGGGFAPRVQP
jgi:hypothetical protein